MTVPSITSLILTETAQAIYDYGIGVATAIGLPVTSWQAGDPTRSAFWVVARKLEALETNVAGYVRSGFLDHATGAWLKLLADQVFGVTVADATYATATITLTNGSTNEYAFDAGDLTFKAPSTGKTYHNTSSGTLLRGPATTLTLDIEADEAGSGSSAAIGDITELVTTYDGVTCTNPTAAVGVDEQDESVTRQDCRDMQDALSPDGARGAYSYVVRTPKYGGTSAITRTRPYGDSTTGVVTMYLAGPSGGSSAADVALAQAAVVRWCTPLCMTPVLAAASNVTVAVTYELWIYKSVNKTVAEIKTAVSTALTTMFAARPIGGDIIAPATTGKLYQSLIAKTVLDTFAQGFRVSVTTPAGDTSLTNAQVAVLGTITATVNLVDDPT